MNSCGLCLKPRWHSKDGTNSLGFEGVDISASGLKPVLAGRL